MRDHNRLRTFEQADLLVESVYRESQCFPRSEEFGLKSQIRRAAEYLRFLDIAYGFAKELGYQIGLCRRLGFIAPDGAGKLNNECATTAKSLCRLIIALRKCAIS